MSMGAILEYNCHVHCYDFTYVHHPFSSCSFHHCLWILILSLLLIPLPYKFYPFLMMHVSSLVQDSAAMHSIHPLPFVTCLSYIYFSKLIYKPTRVFCISSVYSLYRNIQVSLHSLKSSGLDFGTLNCIRL